MEIEQLAEERPDALASIPVDALTGVDAAKAAEIAAAGKFPAEVGRSGRGRCWSGCGTPSSVRTPPWSR